jgi:hypothetical protein
VVRVGFPSTNFYFILEGQGVSGRHHTSSDSHIQAHYSLGFTTHAQIVTYRH